MANSKGNCCKYFTVSLVPVASLILAILFALGIVALPILYVHLAHEYKVSECWASFREEGPPRSWNSITIPLFLG